MRRPPWLLTTGLLVLVLLTACAPAQALKGCKPGETAVYLTAEKMSGAEIRPSRPAFCS